MEFGAATHAGLVRADNEDGYFASNDYAVFAVADGMGGHEHGEVASRLALDVISQRTDAISHANPSDLPILLHTTIQEANAAILAQAATSDAERRMGTTLVVATICGTRLYFAHIGDSRLYLLRGDTFSQLTRDHSLVQSMVDSGEITPEEAAIHPLRHQITRVVGGDDCVSPEIASQALVPGDVLLLCTDGLSGAVDTNAIRRILQSPGLAQDKTEMLVQAALEAGGPDNITVMVLSYHGVAAMPPKHCLPGALACKLPLWQTVIITALCLAIGCLCYALWGYTHPGYQIVVQKSDHTLSLSRRWPLLPMFTPETVSIPTQPPITLVEAQPFLSDYVDVENAGIHVDGKDEGVVMLQQLSQSVVSKLLEDAKTATDNGDFSSAHSMLDRAKALRGDQTLIHQVADMLNRAERKPTIMQ